jgi:ribosome biogenesis GTPase A
VGVVGLPNVGKSSVINSLKRTRVAQVHTQQCRQQWRQRRGRQGWRQQQREQQRLQQGQQEGCRTLLLHCGGGSQHRCRPAPLLQTNRTLTPPALHHAALPFPVPLQVGNTPGITKAVQEVHLDKTVTLLDSPGVVFADAGAEGAAAAALRNAVKAEQLPDPTLPVSRAGQAVPASQPAA